MSQVQPEAIATRRAAIPRGIKTDGWPLFSYGFRPFFLCAGTWATLSLGLWLGHLILGWPLAADYGAANWHAHELLFGYTSAALAGFMLTAIPNWTGRLPVSGGPLMALVALWVAGRIAMLAHGFIGTVPAIMMEAAFLPVLGTIAAREVGAGQNWRNLHVVLGVGLLTLTNALFHFRAVSAEGTGLAYRAAIGVWLMLIMLIGGRLAVSFTHNWLARQGFSDMPKSFGRFDRLTILLTLAGLGIWVVWPDNAATATALAVAGSLQVIRFLRWRGWLAWREPLVWVLHTSYAFIPLGLFGLAGAANGWLGEVSALHLLTAGAIGSMTLAVMTRVTRGHTGRRLQASAVTLISYVSLALAALLRPLADLLPDHYDVLVSASGLLWLLTFLLFLGEHGPMLLMRRHQAA